MKFSTNSKFFGWFQAAIIYFALYALTFSALYPLFFMSITAAKERIEYGYNKLSLPEHPTLGNFARLFSQGDILTWFFNSFLLTVTSVMVCTFVSSLAGFAFAKMKFKGRELLLAMIIPLMILPPIVLIVPIFDLMNKIRLLNTYPSAIIVYVGIFAPFATYLLTSFFRTIPQEILESARLDGCSTFQIYRWIILPISVPPLVTVAVVNSLYIWNDLLIALVLLQSNSMRTLMVGITIFKSRYSVNVPMIMTGALVASLPMLILYFFGQRHFVKGLIAGALK